MTEQKKFADRGNPEPRASVDDQLPRTTLSDGTQIYPAHKEINPATGMQKGYVVLAEEERAGAEVGEAGVDVERVLPECELLQRRPARAPRA